MADRGQLVERVTRGALDRLLEHLREAAKALHADGGEQVLLGLEMAVGRRDRDARAARDLTRGGLASALNEIAATAGCGIEIDETALPLRDEVVGMCEILGLDPLGDLLVGREAQGGQPQAARYAGVPVNRVKILMFMFTAFCAAIFATCQVMEFGSAGADRGLLKEFEAIIAVVIGGAHLARLDIDRLRTEMDYANMAESARTVMTLFPRLGNARIVRFWAGIEGFTPDQIPVIGPAIHAPGAFHAFGFSAHGFQLSPIVGRIVSELILDGRCSLPIEPFRRSTAGPSCSRERCLGTAAPMRRLGSRRSAAGLS